MKHKFSLYLTLLAFVSSSCLSPIFANAEPQPVNAPLPPVRPKNLGAENYPIPPQRPNNNGGESMCPDNLANLSDKDFPTEMKKKNSKWESELKALNKNHRNKGIEKPQLEALDTYKEAANHICKNRKKVNLLDRPKAINLAERNNCSGSYDNLIKTYDSAIDKYNNDNQILKEELENFAKNFEKDYQKNLASINGPENKNKFSLDDEFQKIWPLYKMEPNASKETAQKQMGKSFFGRKLLSFLALRDSNLKEIAGLEKGKSDIRAAIAKDCNSVGGARNQLDKKIGTPAPVTAVTPKPKDGHLDEALKRGGTAPPENPESTRESEREKRLAEERKRGDEAEARAAAAEAAKRAPAPENTPPPGYTQPPPHTPDPKEKEAESSGSMLSSPWLWGALGLGAGVTGGYLYQKSATDKEKKKRIAAEQALAAKTTTTTTDTSTTTTTTVDYGTHSGCKLTQTGSTTSAVVGAALPPITVSIVNSDGTLSSRDNISLINVSCTGTCSLSGTTSIAATAGVATFSNLVFSATDQGVVLTFSGATCTTVNTSAINVSAAGARQ